MPVPAIPPTIAQIGTGGRGRQHLQAIVDPRSGVRLVGICDQHAPTLAEAAAVVPPEVPRFQDADAMLRTLRPTVVTFVTQPGARLPLLELAIRHGARAVVFEKPMATTLAEARTVAARARAAGVVAVVSHQHKYAGHWRAVRQLIAAGELGEIRSIDVASKGWLLQYASHLIDYATFLNGGHAPVEVSGFVAGRGQLTDSHPSPEETFGRLRYANGVQGSIACGPSAPDQHPDLATDFWMNAGATVVGSEGVAQVVVGWGWRAVTARGGAQGSRTARFDGVADTIPLYAEVAECLADPTRRHACGSETALIGHEAMLGLVASAIERRALPVPLPADLGYEPLARLAQVLPAAAGLAQGAAR